MANSWLRLWHDMPNDPKWRTIARVSKQSIPAVMSVYVHLLVIASNATERGRTQNVCSEDIASALDMNAEEIDAIMSAMQGRVLDGDRVSGWSKRQVEREDGSAERSKRWRDAQKEAKKTQPNATERNRTPDTDTDTEVNTIVGGADALPTKFAEFWDAWPSSSRKVGKAACAKKWRIAKLDQVADQIIAHVAAMKGSKQWRDGFDPAPLTYINQQRWCDGAPCQTQSMFDAHSPFAGCE